MVFERNHIAILLPNLKIGGMERVGVNIANYLAKNTTFRVFIIAYLPNEIEFQIDSKVVVIVPIKLDYNHKGFKGFLTALKFIRQTCIKYQIGKVISFGSMYNSFTMLSLIGLWTKIDIFLSDRSNPYRNSVFTLSKGGDERHDGILHYFLKKVLYRKAKGILCQTQLSRIIETKNLNHKNIIYFPNPVPLPTLKHVNKENIILNVGRFVESKQQLLLLKYYQQLCIYDWSLVFVGDGPTLNQVKAYAELNKIRNVKFEGNSKDVSQYYEKAKIFAFTSRSEGFPNSLAEAMSYGLAVISFDCIAGPSDLIENNKNGFLIRGQADQDYVFALKSLVENKSLIKLFSKQARHTVELKFNEQHLMNYLIQKLNEN